jgi:hypothetical protein
MSGNELQRIEILAEVVSRRRTEASAATILAISTRQIRRLVVAYRTYGLGSMEGFHSPGIRTVFRHVALRSVRRRLRLTQHLAILGSSATGERHHYLDR